MSFKDKAIVRYVKCEHCGHPYLWSEISRECPCGKKPSSFLYLHEESDLEAARREGAVRMAKTFERLCGDHPGVLISEIWEEWERTK